MKKVFFIVCDMLVCILRHEILIQTFCITVSRNACLKIVCEFRENNMYLRLQVRESDILFNKKVSENDMIQEILFTYRCRNPVSGNGSQ